METKLQNRDEFIRWYREGRTYQWIVDEYLRKYDVVIGRGTVSNWRSALGLKKRNVTSVDLIPWAVARRHRNAYEIGILRAEARRRQYGDDVLDSELLSKVKSFVRRLKAQKAVVHYDPDTDEGFWIVPARPGVDTDIIRVPSRPTRQRGTRQ